MKLASMLYFNIINDISLQRKSGNACLINSLKEVPVKIKIKYFTISNVINFYIPYIYEWKELNKTLKEKFYLIKSGIGITNKY